MFLGEDVNIPKDTPQITSVIESLLLLLVLIQSLPAFKLASERKYSAARDQIVILVDEWRGSRRAEAAWEGTWDPVWRQEREIRIEDES